MKVLLCAFCVALLSPFALFLLFALVTLGAAWIMAFVLFSGFLVLWDRLFGKETRDE